MRSRTPYMPSPEPGASRLAPEPGARSTSPMRHLPKGRPGETRLDRVSRGLQMLLRHRAAASGICTDAGGWAALDSVLALSPFRRAGVSRSEVLALADAPAQDARRRFQFRQDSRGRALVRAVQGHTMPHVVPEALGRPLGPSDFPGGALVHAAPRDAWFGGHLASGLQPGTHTGQSRRGLVYLSGDEPRMERKLRKSRDRILIRVSVATMRRLGLRLYLSGRGDVLSSDPIPVSCFQSVTGWERGAIQVLWVPADGPPPGRSAGLSRPRRSSSRAPTTQSSRVRGSPHRRRPWVHTGLQPGATWLPGAPQAQRDAQGSPASSLLPEREHVSPPTGRARTRSRPGARAVPRGRASSRGRPASARPVAMSVSSASPRPLQSHPGRPSSPAHAETARSDAGSPTRALRGAPAGAPAPHGTMPGPPPATAIRWGHGAADPRASPPVSAWSPAPAALPGTIPNLGPDGFPPLVILHWGGARYIRVADDAPGLATPLGPVAPVDPAVGFPHPERGGGAPRTPSRHRGRGS